MPEHILNTVDPSAEQSSQRQAGVAVSLWFDLQPESSLKHKVPVWARTLAQAHVDQRVWVLAHPESAYAQSGLMCEVVEGTLWPDESWLDRLKNAIQRAHTQGMSQIVLMLPNRASPIAWAQWALCEFLALGGYLDSTTGLLQGLRRPCPRRGHDAVPFQALHAGAAVPGPRPAAGHPCARPEASCFHNLRSCPYPAA